MKTKFVSSICILVIFLSSCSEIIAPNITKKSITVNFPIDNYTTNTSTIAFLWNDIKGVDYYNLQIIKGSFTNVQQFLIDSNIKSTSFTYVLNPGVYQWRIKAVNNAGSTQFQTYSLNIDSTLELSNQIVTLTSPANNFYTSTNLQTFSWQSLYNASEYRFLLYQLPDSNLLKDETLTTNSFQHTLSEGTYRWFVRAQNEISITSYASRKLTIDNTPPTVPFATYPINNAIISLNDSLKWNSDLNSIADSLYIYSDSLLQQVTKHYVTSNYWIVTGNLGTYYWRLKTIDAAGNRSTFSPTLKYKLQ